MNQLKKINGGFHVVNYLTNAYVRIFVFIIQYTHTHTHTPLRLTQNLMETNIFPLSLNIFSLSFLSILNILMLKRWRDL